MNTTIIGLFALILGLTLHIVTKGIKKAKEKNGWVELWNWFREPVEVLSNIASFICAIILVIAKPEMIGEWSFIMAVACGYSGTSILRNVFKSMGIK